MKKYLLLTLLSILYFAQLNAGSMGNAPTVRPYLGGEANYSWRQINAPTLNFAPGSTSNQYWGGRFSAGIMRFYTDRMALSAEAGGGYYGNTTITAPSTASVGKLAVDGYDILVGTLYQLNYLDLFVKIGFMGETVRSDFKRYNLAQVFNGNLIRGQSRTRVSDTSILPEIRVGGIYNLYSHLGLTLTYLHTFGSTMTYEKNGTATIGSGIQTITNINSQAPTLNSILLGLRYYIV